MIRLLGIQYKTPITETCDHFRNSTLEEIARLHHAQYLFALARWRMINIITKTTRWEVVKISASPKRLFFFFGFSCHFSRFQSISKSKQG